MYLDNPHFLDPRWDAKLTKKCLRYFARKTIDHSLPINRKQGNITSATYLASRALISSLSILRAAVYTGLVSLLATQDLESAKFMSEIGALSGGLLVARDTIFKAPTLAQETLYQKSGGYNGKKNIENEYN